MHPGPVNPHRTATAIGRKLRRPTGAAEDWSPTTVPDLLQRIEAALADRQRELP